MPIYSVPLGSHTSASVEDKLLYTVPGSGGPAVIRSISLTLNPGSFAYVYVKTGGAEPNVAYYDNTAGATGLLVPNTLYQPLEPGDEIHFVNPIGSYSSVVLGGYQFNQP